MLKIILHSFLALIFCVVVLGFLYPLFITLIGQTFFKKQALGSLAFDNKGELRGSYIIGQKFSQPDYLWGRPSFGDYDTLKAGNSNLSLNSLAFQNKWQELKQKGFKADMALESASGLDPHITYQSAIDQVERILKNSSISRSELLQIIDQNSTLDLSGKHYVNVLAVNLMLYKQQNK